jgi:hypothetical protein
MEWGFSKQPEAMVVNTVVGPAKGQVVPEGPVSSWMTSSVGGQEFVGNDEYNVHTHHI